MGAIGNKTGFMFGSFNQGSRNMKDPVSYDLRESMGRGTNSIFLL